MVRWACRIALLLAFGSAAGTAAAQAPVEYRLTFPAVEQGWMQVDIMFGDLPPAPLQIRMSEASPGRYARHEFARNVSDVVVTDSEGAELAVTRPSFSGWDVTGHDGDVRVSYRIAHDVVDGTHIGIDATHAHLNIPATLMWARGLEKRPVVVRFDPPLGREWRVATQLLPGTDPLTYTAPNLQYLMDSPAEVSAFALRTFSVRDAGREVLFRVAMHHQGSDADLERFVRAAETIVRESKGVFGVLPQFDGGSYTFIGDFLPGARADAMEHRNSTVLTSGRPLGWRPGWLENVAHEFFHVWNVERIRPRSLEPFNFEDVNVSGELWLAEGVSDYYAPLILVRAGLTTFDEFFERMASVINAVTLSPARTVRTAEEVSRLAPFVDGVHRVPPGVDVDPYLSYYTWGSAVGLALDLTLRDQSDGRLSLDLFMRALWERFGEQTHADEPGYVERPYTIDDLRTVLGELAGDAAMADEFLTRFVQGHEVADYRRLLEGVGLLLRPAESGVERPRQEIVPFGRAGRQLTERQRRARTAWLSSMAGD